MRSKILLAGPTALYAPIYLAKHLTLSKEFAHIDFEYPKPPMLEENGAKHDELIDEMFTSFKDSRVIMAVADPMRVVLEKFDSHHNKPVVIQTLINKMCYWAITQYPRNKDEIALKDYKIIVHPRGMTGHTLAMYDLIQMFPELAQEKNIADRHLISDMLFHQINPGEESKYFKALWFNKKNVGFVTTEPYDMLKSDETKDKKFILKKSFMHSRDFNNNLVYCKAVMTSLITSEDCLHDPIQKEILIDLIHGIKEAIKFIYAEPKIASKILYEYDDFNHNVTALRDKKNKTRFFPKAMGWTETLMETLFETILAREKIYPQNLEIIDDEINRSKGFWKKRFEFENNLTMVSQLDQFDTYLNKAWQS